MDKDTFLERIKEIGTCEDEVTRRGILAELGEEVSKIYDSNSELLESNKKYEEDNETLRKANMDLFLRVGSDKNDKELLSEETGVKTEEKPKRKYEDLFK